MNEIREQARAAYDRNLAQKNLTERISARMILAHAGGLWRCDQEFISILNCFLHDDEAVLLDSQGIPRKIQPLELFTAVKMRHQEIMNEWLVAYAELARIRTAKDV
jgi:hypothetical protein